MNLRQLECSLAVTDELHFRRAADRVHVAPASVSGGVAPLERSRAALIGTLRTMIRSVDVETALAGSRRTV